MWTPRQGGRGEEPGLSPASKPLTVSSRVGKGDLKGPYHLLRARYKWQVDTFQPRSFTAHFLPWTNTYTGAHIPGCVEIVLQMEKRNEETF